MRIHLPRLSSLLKGLGACVLLLLALAVWALTDRPLDPETREWLRVPPVPANDAAALMQRLHEAAAREDDDAIGHAELGRACAGLDPHCLSFVVEHRPRVLAEIPDNPEYWAAYDELLSAPTMSRDPGRIMSRVGFGYLQAVRWSAVREMAEHGGVRPAFAVRTLTAQRGLLAESPSLIDKMVFTAATGMGFNLVLMSMQATPPGHADFDALVAAAAPLDRVERSLAGAMGGEVRLMMHQLDQPPWSEGWSSLWPPRNRLANARRRYLTPLVMLSELPPAEFWQTPARQPVELAMWDWFLDPTSAWMAHMHEIAAPAYASYPATVQQLELIGRVVRTWGRVLTAGGQGRFERLAEPAPPGWRWRQDVPALCLTPERLPAWLDRNASEVCLPGRSR